MNSKKSVILILILSFCLALCGCSKDAARITSEETVSEEQSASVDSDLKIIGIKAGSDVAVTLKNKTGKVISDLCIKSSNDEDFSASLLGAGDSMKKNEARVLYYALEDDKDVTYDLELLFSDATSAVIHDFPFTDTEECLIWMDGVAYIDYLSESSGNRENTKEAEMDLRLMEETGLTLEELKAVEDTVTPTEEPEPSETQTTTTTGGSSNYSGGGSSSYSGGGSSSYSGGGSSSYSGGGSSSSSGSGSSSSSGGSSSSGDTGSSGSGSGSGSSGSDNSGGSSSGSDDDIDFSVVG